MSLELPPWVRKFRLALAAGAVALACILFFAFRLSRVSDLEEQNQRAEDEVRMIQRNIDNGENLESQLSRIEKITDRISERTVIPEDASVNKAYFYQFETPRLKIESVEQRDPVAGNDSDPWHMKLFNTVEFTIIAVGNYTDVLDLAYQIRGGPKLVRVTSLSVLPEGPGDQRRLELTIQAIAEKKTEDEDNE